MSDEVNIEELEGLLTEGTVAPDALDTGVENEPSAPVEGDEQHKRRKKHRKERKRRRHSGDGSSDEEHHRKSKYVIDAAESGDSEDDFVADSEGTEDGFDGVAQYQPRNHFIFHDGDEAKSAEELGREYEERLQAMRNRDLLASQTPSEMGFSKDQMSSLRFASHLLPQNTDPKVFAVKCRPRMTRVLVARVVNKCYAYRVGKNYERKRVDLGIISVFCLDHVKEYIYVEAYRKLFVENALNGLEGWFRFSVTLVNPSELMQMMEQRPSNEKLRVGAFVRLRQRHYRMDLAQVTQIHSDGVHITCKAVPREDFIGKPFNKSSTRLPPKFFVPSLSVDVVDHGDHYRWGDYSFDRDGYILRTVSCRMVISGAQMEQPSTEELALFFNNSRERVREAIARTSLETIQQPTLMRIGDTVRVTSGQLRETVGSIENIYSHSNTVVLSCRVPGRPQPVTLRVELSACVKFFSEGTHVIVARGEYEGESGTVVRSMGDVVQLFSDRMSTNREFTVRANDCHQSKLVGSFGHSYGSWRLFDLVMFSDSTSVACIVRFNRNDVVVLTERNETRVLAPAQIKSAVRSARQTTDRLQNVVVRGAEVSIQQSPLTPFNLVGQTVRVEQVFNHTIFVRSRNVKDNAGVVALDANCVLVMGGRTTTKHVAPPQQLPAPVRRPHNATQADLSVAPNSESVPWRSTSDWYEPETTV